MPSPRTAHRLAVPDRFGEPRIGLELLPDGSQRAGFRTRRLAVLHPTAAMRS
jgi:hypothetical protein